MFTTYVILMRQNNQKKVMDGIAFYRSNLHHILPIMNSISKLESAEQTLAIALDNIIEGHRGFPAMHDGLKHLKQDELRELIESESKKLQMLCTSEWLSIFPATLSIPITKIWSRMFVISNAVGLESQKSLRKNSRKLHYHSENIMFH